MEIVSEPEIKSPGEAKEYVSRLRQLVRYLGVSDGDMEKGSLRVDANVSITREDGSLGTKVEVKNMNSLRALERALEYEIDRQGGMLGRGEDVFQETRHWDDSKGITTGSRGKEAAHDYRYFPDPDLPPLVLPEGFVEKQRLLLPEMPWVVRDHFSREWGLSQEDASALTELPELASYTRACVAEGVTPQRAANWIRTEVLRVLNERKIPIRSFSVPASELAALLSKIDGGILSTTLAKKAFDLMVSESLQADAAIRKIGAPSGKLSGEELRDLILRVMEREKAAVDEIREGKDAKGKKRGFLCGLVMREARGQADHAEVASVLGEILGNL